MELVRVKEQLRVSVGTRFTFTVRIRVWIRVNLRVNFMVQVSVKLWFTL